MKAIHIKEILHRIRKTKVTFFSIAFIISLGVSTYLGISFAQLSMEKTGDNYFKDVKFHNIEISSKTGLTQDDIEYIKDLKHIDKVEGGYVTTGFLSLHNEKRLVTVQSVTYDVDKATVIEGRLPEKENEIAIEKVMKDDDHLKVGDTITQGLVKLLIDLTSPIFYTNKILCTITFEFIWGFRVFNYSPRVARSSAFSSVWFKLNSIKSNVFFGSSSLLS